jgi:hypothetical protein
MEADRGHDVKNYTDDQLAELIDQSLKQTAKDVREGRIPLDGRARIPLPEIKDEKPDAAGKIPDAAE